MAFADIIALLVPHLQTVAGTVPVASAVPTTRPVEFIQVRRAGGPAVWPVFETVRVDVLTWARSEPRSFELATAMRAAIWELRASTTLGATVYDVAEFMGPSILTDPQSGSPLTMATYDLSVRAEIAA